MLPAYREALRYCMILMNKLRCRWAFNAGLIVSIVDALSIAQASFQRANSGTSSISSSILCIWHGRYAYEPFMISIPQSIELI